MLDLSIILHGTGRVSVFLVTIYPNYVAAWHGNMLKKLARTGEELSLFSSRNTELSNAVSQMSSRCN
jgi:hypothetical protein